MSEPKRLKPHEFIWLQWYGCDQPTSVDDDDNETPEPLDDLEEPSEIQWCEDRIFDTDILYVSADRLDALTAERDKLQQRIVDVSNERDHLDYRLRYEAGAECNKLLSALDDIVTAWELPGDHCELGDAIKAARNLLPEGKA